jgi:hypothetical protein
MASEADVWRTALQAKGRDWVLAELETRPGRPDDVVYDVVFEPPFPTREFCQRWCVEDDNRFLHVATSTKAALCVLVMLILFAAMGIHSLSSSGPQKPGSSTHATSSWGTPPR